METNAYLRDSDVAELLKINVKKVQLWRREGIGPRYYRIGQRMIRYRKEKEIMVCSDTYMFLYLVNLTGDDGW
jgi:hypothetical protein